MNLAQKAVLIVDDFQNMRSTLRQMLLSIGFENITPVATGEEALAALRARRFDIVLCDYNLGDGIDGQQLLDQARSEGHVGLGTVFVMVTAENSNEMVMGALESAPDAYLSKPFTKDLLGARLGRALRKREPLLPVARTLAAEGPAAALAVLDRLLEQEPANRLEMLRLRAELAFAIGDLDATDRACMGAMAAKPLAWALTQRGQVAERRGDPEAAEAFYRESIRLTPHFMAAHDRLAALLESHGRVQDALELLAMALERSPKSLQRQRRLGRLASQLGRHDLAEPAWRRALAISQQMGLADPSDYLGLIQVLVARDDQREAERQASRIARRCRSDLLVGYWVLAGKLHCLRGAKDPERSAVLQELDQTLAQAPVPERVLRPLAEAVVAAGEADRYPALSASVDSRASRGAALKE